MKTVWVVKKNADGTEGRGPMLLHSVWNCPRDVVATWLDKQGGVMGRKHTSQGGVMDKKWSEKKQGDWSLESVPVFTNEEDINEFDNGKSQRKALAKLSDAEKIVLGLDKKYPESMS